MKGGCLQLFPRQVTWVGTSLAPWRLGSAVVGACVSGSSRSSSLAYGTELNQLHSDLCELSRCGEVPDHWQQLLLEVLLHFYLYSILLDLPKYIRPYRNKAGHIGAYL